MVDIARTILGIVVVLAALIPLSIFVFRYITHSPWDRTSEGKNLLYQKVGWLLLMISSMINLLLGRYPGSWIVQLSVFLILVVLFWIDVFQLLAVQKKHPYRRYPKSRK